MQSKVKKLTENSINKMLQKVWDEGNTPEDLIPQFKNKNTIIKTGGGFTSKRKGKYYKFIKGVYRRVYKKYNYQPKPLG